MALPPPTTRGLPPPTSARRPDPAFVATAARSDPELEFLTDLDVEEVDVQPDPLPPPPDPRFAPPRASTVEPHIEPDAPPSRAGSVLSWLLLVVVAAAFALFFVAVYLPVQQEREEMSAQVEQGKAGLQDATEALEQEQGRNAELAAERDAVAQDAETSRSAKQQVEAERAQLAKEVAAREAELAQLKKAQDKLADALKDEIASGEISVSRRHRELVLDVTDRVLFDQGAAELNARGQKVLRRVSETILEHPDRVFQVRGHTDNVPLSGSLTERFPTNWELSVLRATHVVRFLEEQCKVKGGQLSAAGFSFHRPVSSNKTGNGRRRNRRIEIVMLEVKT